MTGADGGRTGRRRTPAGMAWRVIAKFPSRLGFLSKWTGPTMRPRPARCQPCVSRPATRMRIAAPPGGSVGLAVVSPTSRVSGILAIRAEGSADDENISSTGAWRGRRVAPAFGARDGRRDVSRAGPSARGPDRGGPRRDTAWTGDARRAALRGARRARPHGPAPRRGHGPGAPAGTHGASCCSATRCSTRIPRFFGYITAAPAPIGMLGDLLAAAVNPNVGAWTLSPAATEIESQTVRWIAELIGYPADCGGLLVSGGNMANFVGFLAARAAKSGWDVRERGVAGEPGRRLRVYGSAETHTWIQKAADLAGLGTASIRWIPTDARSPHGRGRAAPADRGGRRGRRRAAAWWSVPPGRSARAPWTRCPTSRRCAGSTAPGFTWMAPTAASRPRCPTRPTTCAG